MDRIALQTLRDEMRDDDRIMQDAFAKATARFARKDEVAYEACAHQLCRLYDAFEQACLRLAKAFENRIDDDLGVRFRLRELASIATRIDRALPEWCEGFLNAVRREQGW